MAYVPLPRVFPVLYYERGMDRKVRVGIMKSEGLGGTWQGTVCAGDMMFVASACGSDWI